MKALLTLVALVVLSTGSLGQNACRDAPGEIVQRHTGLTVHHVLLPSIHGVIAASAAIPDNRNPRDGVVFTFSMLAISEPKRSIEILPLAIELGRRGLPTVVIERKLTWPEIDPSIGTMQPAAICAQQWLSTHAATRVGWKFVGPDVDSPTPEQFRIIKDPLSMRFWVTFPVGNESDDNTDNFIHHPSYLMDSIAQPFVDGLADR